MHVVLAARHLTGTGAELTDGTDWLVEACVWSTRRTSGGVAGIQAAPQQRAGTACGAPQLWCQAGEMQGYQQSSPIILLRVEVL